MAHGINYNLKMAIPLDAIKNLKQEKLGRTGLPALLISGGYICSARRSLPSHFKRVSCIIQSTLSLSLSLSLSLTHTHTHTHTNTHTPPLPLLYLALFILFSQVFLLARSSVSDMSGSNFGDSMGWSSSGRRGKRGGGSAGGTDKPKQPQRGLGVAQLEKIRLQSEMAEYFHPLGQPPSLIHRTGSLNLVSDDGCP